VRASLLTTVLGLALIAAPAHADAAEGWGTVQEVNTLEALLLLAGVPVLLFLLITAAVYIPAIARGEDVSPTNDEPDDHWLGGPRPGTKELTSGDAGRTETGGARGSW
jgi:hypothetical protein